MHLNNADNMPRPPCFPECRGRIKTNCLTCDAWLAMDLDLGPVPCRYCGETEALAGPLPPTCDFCGSGNGDWINEATFLLDPRPDTLDSNCEGDWVACAECQKFIVRLDPEALALRAAFRRITDLDNLEIILARVVSEQETFWRAQTGKIRRF